MLNLFFYINRNLKEDWVKMEICLKNHNFAINKYLKKMVVKFYSSDYGLSKKKYRLICISFKKYNYFDISKLNNFKKFLHIKKNIMFIKMKSYYKKLIVNE